MKRFAAFCVSLLLVCSLAVPAFATSANEQTEASYATFTLRPHPGPGASWNNISIGARGKSSASSSLTGFASTPFPGNYPGEDTRPAGSFSGFNVPDLGGASYNFTIEYGFKNGGPFDASDFSTYINGSPVSGWDALNRMTAEGAFYSIDFSTLPDLEVPAGGSVAFLFTLYPLGLSVRNGSAYSSMLPARDPVISFPSNSSAHLTSFTPSADFVPSTNSPPGFSQYNITTDGGIVSKGFTLDGSFINGSASNQSFSVRWYNSTDTTSGNNRFSILVPCYYPFPADLPASFDGVRVHFGVSYTLLVYDAAGDLVGGEGVGGGGESGGDYMKYLIQIAEDIAGSHELLQAHLPEIVALLHQINTATGNLDANVALIKSRLDAAALQLDNMAGTLNNIRTDTAAMHSLLSSYLHYLEDISATVTSINTELKSFHSDFLSFMNATGDPDNIATPEQQEALGQSGSVVSDLDKVEDENFDVFDTAFQALGFTEFSFSTAMLDAIRFVGDALDYVINSNPIFKAVLIFPIFLGFIKAFLNMPAFPSRPRSADDEPHNPGNPGNHGYSDRNTGGGGNS